MPQRSDFLDHMVAAGVPFDVIGHSYYSWYHGPMSAMEQNMRDLVNRYHKYVMIAEDQYPSVSDYSDYGTYSRRARTTRTRCRATPSARPGSWPGCAT